MPCTISQHLSIRAGTTGDYAALKGFHYREGHPGAITRVFAAWYEDAGAVLPQNRSILAGVLVESLPALGCALRSAALPRMFAMKDRRMAAAKLNRDMRTISRVIVHPMFRSTGLAVGLVRHVLQHAQTPYIEALAAMGRVHPFFERAGMTPFDRPPLPEAVRFAAALQREQMAPLHLVDAEARELPPFLQKELRRFSGLGAGASREEHLARARRRLLSQPVYYLWRSPTTDYVNTKDEGHEGHEEPRKELNTEGTEDTEGTETTTITATT
jgi:GNAT superfamily N-acetyltransferase